MVRRYMGADYIYDQEWAPGSVEKKIWDLLVPSSTEYQLETIMGIVADFKSELAHLKHEIDEREEFLRGQIEMFAKGAIKLEKELAHLKHEIDERERKAAEQMAEIAARFIFPRADEEEIKFQSEVENYMQLWESEREKEGENE